MAVQLRDVFFNGTAVGSIYTEGRRLSLSGGARGGDAKSRSLCLVSAEPESRIEAVGLLDLRTQPKPNHRLRKQVGKAGLLVVD